MSYAGLYLGKPSYVGGYLGVDEVVPPPPGGPIAGPPGPGRDNVGWKGEWKAFLKKRQLEQIAAWIASQDS